MMIEELPDWLGGGYTGGYNFKAHYIKILWFSLS